MIPALDGLRALFLTWVMFVHSPDQAVPGFLSGIHEHWILGVDGFMAISGFLVTKSLLKSDSLRDFMIRRVSRIFPPYYLTLLFIGMIAWVTQNGLYQNLKSSWVTLLGFPLFFANYTIPASYQSTPVLLQPYWSISFQEQFYILLAGAYALAASVGKLKQLLVLAGLGSILLRLSFVFWFWKGQQRGWEYEANLHLALDSMSWGCLAWLYYNELGKLWSTRQRAWTSNTLIVIALIAAVSARSFWHDSNSMAILSIFRAPILALFVRMICEINGSHVGKLLATKPLRALGNISYETYLLHPIFYAALEKTSLAQGPQFYLVAYPLLWIAGYTFHHAFGRPCQRLLKRALQTKSAGPGLETA